MSVTKDDIKKILDEVKTVGAQLNETRERLDKYEKRDGVAPGDIKDMEQRIVDAITPKLVSHADMESILTRTDQIETQLNKSKGNNEEHKVDLTEHQIATRAFFRNGESAPEVQEFVGTEGYHTLSESTDTEGGFLVDPITEAEIAKNVLEISRVREVARVTSINTSSLRLRKRISGPTGYWAGESATVTKTQSVYGRVEIPVHAYLVQTQVSRDLLMDVPNFESEITFDAAEALGDGESLAFISGDGVNEPEGLDVNAEITTSAVTGGDTSTHLVEADDYYSLLVALKEKYRAKGVFLLNSVILGKTLKLKESGGGYVWHVNLADGPVATIAGKPYVICEDLESDGTINLNPVFFGDFNRGYRIADRIGIEVTRDPYSVKPDIDFMFRKRVGAGVYMADAIRKLKCG